MHVSHSEHAVESYIRRLEDPPRESRRRDTNN